MGTGWFSGSGLSAVNAAGETCLPRFALQTLFERSGERRLILGAHESDECIAGFDPGRASALHEELERRRLAGEAAGESHEEHHARARRLFGISEEASFETNGRFTLPPLQRRRGRIGDLALFVGTGAAFEIWNPSIACERGGDLRALAEFRLGELMNGDREEEE